MNDTTPPLELSGDASKAQQVTAKVVEILVEQFGGKPDEIRLQTNVADDLGADSIDSVEVLMALEEEFQIEITDEEGDTYKTVADIVASILRLTDGPGKAS